MKEESFCFVVVQFKFVVCHPGFNNFDACLERKKVFRLRGVVCMTDIFVCRLQNSDLELSVFELVYAKVSCT